MLPVIDTSGQRDRDAPAGGLPVEMLGTSFFTTPPISNDCIYTSFLVRGRQLDFQSELVSTRVGWCVYLSPVCVTRELEEAFPDFPDIPLEDTLLGTSPPLGGSPRRLPPAVSEATARLEMGVAFTYWPSTGFASRCLSTAQALQEALVQD